MPKDRIVELNLVVRLDRRIDEDLELLIRDYLESEGLLEVKELTRVGLTGTIDLPRVWLPSATNEELAQLAARPPPPLEETPPPPVRPVPWWRKKR